MPPFSCTVQRKDSLRTRKHKGIFKSSSDCWRGGFLDFLFLEDLKPCRDLITSQTLCNCNVQIIWYLYYMGRL